MFWINAMGNYNPAKQMQFFMDSDADVANLPTPDTGDPTPGTSYDTKELKCSPGSLALSLSSGKLYVLNSAGTWAVFGGTDSSSSNNSSNDNSNG